MNGKNIQRVNFGDYKSQNRHKRHSMVEQKLLFENLIPMNELLLKLKHHYSRSTVYRWVGQGMPHKKIKGKLWFPWLEVALWLDRTSH